MKSGWTAGILAAAAVVWVHGAGRAQAPALPDNPAAQTSAQVAAIPDNPRPQTLPSTQGVTPGRGSSASTDAPADPDEPGATLPNKPSTTVDPETKAADTVAPDIIPETGPGGRVSLLRTNVRFVEVPFTVKDNKGQLVPGLTWRDVHVFENGVRKQLRLFTVDPYPLSVAFVVDQSLPYQTMKTVNIAMGAVQGAFTPYDEMAVFTYNNGTNMRTDYTGAQSPRLAAVLEQAKSEGREANFAALGNGPLEQNIYYNSGAAGNIDPNTNARHGTALPGSVNNLPKEQHPLNDAIFEAAHSLSTRPNGRRRVIYIVSDGRESGSKVKTKDLIRYLQTNNIAVYATVVGDSATPYIGFLDKYHIPFTMRENLLPQYAAATGGEAISEFRIKGIETSFQKIAEEVRIQYTAGYYSNEPFTDGKYRPLEVQVLRPGLDVIAKKGYYPSPEAIPAASQGR